MDGSLYPKFVSFIALAAEGNSGGPIGLLSDWFSFPPAGSSSFLLALLCSDIWQVLKNCFGPASYDSSFLEHSLDFTNCEF
jgi:hypothetical protein